MGKSTPFAIDFVYGSVRRMPTPSNQSEKFKDAARQNGADEDEHRWEERLRKVAKHKPQPERDEPTNKVVDKRGR